MTRRTRSVWLLVTMALAAPGPARGQDWSVGVSAGRTVYDPDAIDLGTSNLVGTVRYDPTPDGHVFGAVAAPVRNGDTFWGVLGGGTRLAMPERQDLRFVTGADVDGHVFLFRDAVAQQTGRGAAASILPFAGVAAGDGRVEVRGGWRGQTLAFAGTSLRRGVFETGARASYGRLLRVEGDLSWVRTDGVTYPFAGARLTYGGRPVSVWLDAGRWLGDLDEVAWGAGAAMRLGDSATVWGGVRQDAPDPLYWNSPRLTWSVGLTRRLGARRPAARTAARVDDGTVLVGIPVEDVPGTAVSIAGDFNDWQPEPMRREGDAWVIRLQLPPGVYYYAFRTADGRWFVPSSVVGRRDDGMGGHTAVLVVT